MGFIHHISHTYILCLFGVTTWFFQTYGRVLVGYVGFSVEGKRQPRHAITLRGHWFARLVDAITGGDIFIQEVTPFLAHLDEEPLQAKNLPEMDRHVQFYPSIWMGFSKPRVIWGRDTTILGEEPFWRVGKFEYWHTRRLPYQGMGWPVILSPWNLKVLNGLMDIWKGFFISEYP